MVKKGKKSLIILLSGASSSGKTTLAKALKLYLKNENIKFIHQEPDLIAKKINSYDIDVITKEVLKPTIKGNNIIVDGLLPYNNPKNYRKILTILKEFRLVHIGVHCSLSKLKEREKRRGDRTKGWAKKQFYNIHKKVKYNFEVNTSSNSIQDNCALIASYIKKVI